jgi:hypothetical protein
MAWNFMQVELVPADMAIKPTIGRGGLTRDQAFTEVQSQLDEAAIMAPALRSIADTWRRGAADDTVYAGSLIWTIYEHPEDEDPRRAALVWLEDFAAKMRSAGLTNVQVAKLP